MKKVIRLTESDLIHLVKRVIEEQPNYNTGAGTFYGTYGYDKEGKTEWTKMDPHVRNTILAIGSEFIPVIGPFIAAGIGLYDASLYYKEGNKTEAAIVGILSALPAVGSVLAKIPGVKKLGTRGMEALGKKIIKKQPLDGFEQQVLKSIAKESQLIKSEKNTILNFFKNKKPAAQKLVTPVSYQRIIPQDIKTYISKLTNIKVNKAMENVFKKHLNDLSITQGALKRLAAGTANTTKIEYNSADIALDNIMNVVKNTPEGQAINFKSLLENAYRAIDELEDVVKKFPNQRQSIENVQSGIHRFLSSMGGIMNRKGGSMINYDELYKQL